MTDFEDQAELLHQLRSPDVAGMHWTDTSGWVLAEAMEKALLTHQRERVQASPYWSCSMDEATDVSKTAWLCVHIYILEDFVRKPVFVKLIKVVGSPDADNLLELLVGGLFYITGATPEELASKLYCSNAPGLTTQAPLDVDQLQDQVSPFLSAAYEAAAKVGPPERAELGADDAPPRSPPGMIPRRTRTCSPR
jgi:hypothetical protein